MEDAAPQLSNAEIGFGLFTLGLMALWIARLRERGTIGPRLRRFIRVIYFTSAYYNREEPEPEEWKKPELPKRSKWLFLLSWWGRVPDVSRGPVAFAGVMFIAAIGFWAAALITGT